MQELRFDGKYHYCPECRSGWIDPNDAAECLDSHREFRRREGLLTPVQAEAQGYTTIAMKAAVERIREAVRERHSLFQKAIPASCYTDEEKIRIRRLNHAVKNMRLGHCFILDEHIQSAVNSEQ